MGLNDVSLTLTQKFQSAMAALLPPKDMKVGIDVSHWRPVLKAEELRGNIDFIISKAVEVDDNIIGWNEKMSVDKFCTAPKIINHHAQVAYDLNLPFGIYIYDNPAYKMSWGAKDELGPYKNWPRPDQMAETLALRQAAGTKMMYHSIIIDVERWWYTYAQYYADPKTAVIVPSTWIRDSVEFLEYNIKKDMVAGNLRTVPILFYTGKWFVDRYCPELDSFLASRKQWLAAYPQPFSTNASKVKSWSELHALIDLLAFTPAWIGNKDCELHQITDRGNAPGVYDDNGKPLQVDVNRARVPLSEIFAPGKWSEGTTTPPPPVVNPPPTTAHTVDDVYKQIEQLSAKVDEVKEIINQVRGHYK